jgi:phosphatidylethanolamine/phosphatidyl-N-methylethanolamine N-methyltransferase
MTVKNRHKTAYDRIADQYDLIFSLLLGPGQQMAVNAMDLKPKMKLLEIGIGTGLTLPRYPSGISITGIDVSEGMLEKAREKVEELKLKNVDLKLMSAESLDFPDNSFDRVFAPSVLSVVNDPVKVLDEMVRTCKPGGYICAVAHFAGQRPETKLIDKVFEPFTQKLFGFRMTTPHDFMEKHPGATVILKKNILLLNFNILYMLQKGT